MFTTSSSAGSRFLILTPWGPVVLGFQIIQQLCAAPFLIDGIQMLSSAQESHGGVSLLTSQWVTLMPISPFLVALAPLWPHQALDSHIRPDMSRWRVTRVAHQ